MLRNIEVTACKLPQTDALRLVAKVRNCRTFVSRGIEVTVSAPEDEADNDLYIMVHADTAEQAGIGKGYILALAGL